MLDSLEVAKLEHLWAKRRRKIFLKNSIIAGLLLCVFIGIFAILKSSSSDEKLAAAKVENSKNSAVLKKAENSENSGTLKNPENSENSNNLENSKNSKILENSNSSENSTEQEVANLKDLNQVEQSSQQQISALNEQIKEELREQLKEEIKAEITRETIEREELQKEQEAQLLALKQKARRELELERMNKIASEMNMQRYFSPQQNTDEMNFINSQNYQEQSVNQDVGQANNNFNNNANFMGSKPKGVVKISSAPAKPKASEDDITTIEQNFKESKEPKYALSLAQKYYEKGDYDKAAKWAYELNNVDKNSPQGWILFAKSKYKSGNKSDALRVLEAYKPKASDKKEIQDLINQMKQNLNIR